MSSIRVQLGGKSFEIETEPGVTLLAALRASGFTLPAVCGGRGKCGKCRVSVNGISRLACRVIPNDGDIVVLTESGGGRILTETPKIIFSPAEATGLAAAVDLGTTTIAARIYDLVNGRELKTVTAWNAQAAYGADVISRIQYTTDNPKGLEELSHIARTQVCNMISDALSRYGKPVSELRHIVLVGNTVMQHIFACLPVKGIAVAPFTPETLFSADFKDKLLSAPLHYAPCISGYVGGDITAGVMSTKLYQKSGQNLLLDVGTNGEMVLGGKNGFRCCAVASGPAFEGAGISCGMAAVDGAVSHVRYNGGFLFDTIGGQTAKGICGSGLIDLIAVLTELGCIDEGGRLLPPEDAPEKMRRYVSRDENGNGVFRLTGDICLTAQDVRNLQLAKAAVAAGIKVLLDNAGINETDLNAVYLAGGFGSYVDTANAMKIGMLPRISPEKLHNIGNTALAGASMAAVDPKMIERMRSIARNCDYIELTGRSDFAEAFTKNMSFENLQR